MGEESTIDPKVEEANVMFLVGFISARKLITLDDMWPNNGDIQHVYNRYGYAAGEGFEQACSHYMSRNLDEPVNSDKEWAEFNAA